MNFKLFGAIALIAFAATGCSDKSGDTGDTSGGGGDGTDGGGGDPSASVSWGGSSVTLNVTDGPGAYWFGMAETGASDDPWTGEDCLYGYTLGDGTNLSYCHDAGDGGDTTLSYGGDAMNLQAGTTVFTSSSYDGSVAYYLESDPDFGGTGECWAWGNGAGSYYSELGCGSI